MILEGLVTTIDADGRVNLAPMGPQVGADLRQLVLRPYQTSTTYGNLKRHGVGVFHVTDDVELLARAAVKQAAPLPPLAACSAVDVPRLADVCRWFAFRVGSLDDSQPRTTIVAEVVERGTVREFLGFNRGKHAVVEAAILATRVGLLEPQFMAQEYARLRVLVEKTGGPSERRAFDFLQDYIDAAHADRVRSVVAERTEPQETP